MDDAGKVYEIAIENRAHMLFIREQQTEMKHMIKDLVEKHEKCPGKLHAIKAEGAGNVYSRFALFVGVVGSLVASVIAIIKTFKI
jgi:hypothetical protein